MISEKKEQRSIQVPEREFDTVMVNLSEMCEHEETIDTELDALITSVENLGELIWPMIVSKPIDGKYVILDGHHRHKGLMRIGAQTCPTAIIDYLSDDQIQVESWLIVCDNSIDELVQEINYNPQFGLTIEKSSYSKGSCSFKSDLIDRKFCAALVGNGGEIYVIRGSRDQAMRFMNIYAIKNLRYFDCMDSLYKILETSPNTTGFFPWSYTKKEVVECALKGHVFPPKSTRHYMPWIPARISVPLSECMYKS
ncbi:MAG: ParB N-terminal domain-containing protein [Candidatus Heimdallarchaeota archaeon]|nr:ParB N-terminal domain-containing protein [Candidatus Heimdallarchaeota archaeon]MCK5047902.1 ParB N-terminal domain-containing protein [Candidatus Heimdallarchaeota archaeon]